MGSDEAEAEVCEASAEMAAIEIGVAKDLGQALVVGSVARVTRGGMRGCLRDSCDLIEKSKASSAGAAFRGVTLKMRSLKTEAGD